MLTLLILTILLPFVGAILVLPFKTRQIHPIAVAASALALVTALWAMVQTLPGSTEHLFGQMPWMPGMEQTRLFGVALDSLGAIMLMVACAIGLLIVAYSTEYISPRNREHPEEDGSRRYYFWLLLFIGSMAGIALSPNLLQLFIFWELTTLCSWALISYTQEEKALRAGFKALIMTYIGGLFYLVGLFILFVSTKSFGFDALKIAEPSIRAAVFLLFLIAGWAKAAQIPFYTWLPDAMEAPTPISAYLHAAAMVKAGVYLVARLVAASWAVSPTMGLVVAIMAMLTMFMALLLYFLQDDLKRLLAYSTIAHLGYVLLGLSLGIMGSAVGFQGGVLHIVCHGFAKSTLFLCVGAIAYATGTRSIRELSGLGRRMPLVALAFFAGVLAVTGVPPFACFWSKFFILTGTFATVSLAGPILLVLVALESLISFGWFLYIGQKVFFGPPSEATLQAKDPPFAMSGVLAILVVLCLVAPFIGLDFSHQVTASMPTVQVYTAFR